MAYQGSAQSVGFRNRTVIDPSKRMRQEAQQIKEQGRERVQGMEKQASQEISEMRRVSDIQASNSDYELKALSKFSNTLTSFLEEDLVDIEKRRIEGEIEEGKKIYAEQGPAYQQQQKEVQEAANRSYDLDVKATEISQNAPTDEAADQVRQLSRWKEHGYQLAAMKESGTNFGVYLDNELSTNETLIQDPNGGPAFKIKDYDPSQPDQYEAAVNYLQNEYIKDHNPAGLSAKVVNTTLIPSVDSATNVHRKQYYRQQKIERATLDLETASVSLTESLTGNQAFPKADIAINGYLVQSADAFKRQGVTNPRQAARQQLIKIIQSRAASDPENVENLITMVSSVNIKGHPAGEKNLFQLYGTEITANGLRAKAINQEVSDFDLRQKDSKLDVLQIVEAYKTAVNNGSLSGTDQILALKEIEKYEIYHPDIINDARAYVPLRFGQEESKALAEAYLKEQGGEISKEQLMKLDADVAVDYEKYSVDALFSDGQDDVIKEQNKKIEGTVRGIKGDYDQNKALTADAIAATSAAQRKLVAEAQRLYQDSQRTDSPLSKADAIRMAGDRISQYIKEGNDPKNPQNRNEYYYTTNEGFKQFNQRNIPGISKAYIETQNIIDSYKNQSKLNSNPAINSNLQIPVNRLELTENGTPDSVFFALARLSGSTAFEILNAQRAKQQPSLAKLEMPKEAQTVDAIIKQNPDLKPLFLAGQSYNRINRGMEQISASVPNLMKAIGFQESSGNYKAYNDDSYGPTNPALGKYQILWKNVKSWSKKYGMPHPGTQEDFRNNPTYQETLARKAFEGYVQDAAKKAQDRETIIRMAAAAWYGGPGAMKEYDNPKYSGGAGYPNMQEYTLSVLEKYKGGMF